MNEKKENKLDKLASNLLSIFRDHPFAQLMTLMGAVIAFGIAVESYVREVSNRKEEREARAWALLTTPATGNSGKIWSIEYLLGRGIELNGLDLSCQAMRPELTTNCNHSVYLKNLNLSESTTPLRDINLSGANLEGANASDITISNSIFSGANLSLTSFANSTLHNVRFSDATLHMVDVTGTKFTGQGITGMGVSELWTGARISRIFIRAKNPKSPPTTKLPSGYPDNWLFVCPDDFRVIPSKDTFETECETYSWPDKEPFYKKKKDATGL